ncbi:hypothetical protein E2562_007229 [Oryza meyeriana var. granulata]|uniref:Phosphotyrosine protein phosphatase I domain-containing protein n=1 Tax=Oryza meyeriana var. granulata TaxID=110450 RepID=A0A6G1CED2_9ORYZ|nr:hypothetical protein E2562_007229 [Oryza meyeriana var. granulata]
MSWSGNICRSPAAEAVFRNLVSKCGLESKFLIDSAGTIGYHEGNKADSRMRSASKKRGIEVTSISRPVKPSDFRDFDLILAMDRQNYGCLSIHLICVSVHLFFMPRCLMHFYLEQCAEDLLSSFERWRHREPLPDSAPKKVLDLLEDACESLLDSILAENANVAA